MTQISEQALQSAVREYRDPYLNKDLYQLGAVKSLNADERGNVTLMVELPYPSKGIAGALKQLVGNALEDVAGVENVDVHVGQKIHSYKVQKDLPAVPGVKNIVAVASGKGGVGKSTTAVNLALAFICTRAVGCGPPTGGVWRVCVRVRSAEVQGGPIPARARSTQAASGPGIPYPSTGNVV